MLRNTLLAAIATLAFATTANAATFGLAGSLGATPTFAITNAGQTATFSSVAGNGFAVQSTTNLLTFSTALLDTNFFGTDPLTITFSAPVTGSITIPFAILDAFGLGTDVLTVTASNGQKLTVPTTSNNLGLGEPEGVALIKASSAISSLTLTSPIAFAIGDVTTSAATAAVPEPASMAVLGTGLLGLVALRRQRRHRG